jgi:hypothetical protein
MPDTDLTGRQLELIARLAALEPPVFFMGGFAEDALLAGRVTRPHEDVDVIFPREQAPLHLDQLGRTRVHGLGDLGRGGAGRSLLPLRQSGDLKVDLGVLDQENGGNWMRVHRLAFTVEGEEAPAGYRLRLPDDMFDQAAVELEGIPIRPISPLALYQIRAGVAERNSFGPLSERQIASMAELRERFFPELPEDALLPPAAPLSG